MTEEVNTYEQEENRHRARMPAIFSVASFDSQTSSEALIFESKAFFVKMLETIKNWSDQASERIRVHNEQLKLIQREVLMTVQEIIDRATAQIKAQLTAEKNKEQADAATQL